MERPYSNAWSIPPGDSLRVFPAIERQNGTVGQLLLGPDQSSGYPTTQELAALVVREAHGGVEGNWKKKKIAGPQRLFPVVAIHEVHHKGPVSLSERKMSVLHRDYGSSCFADVWALIAVTAAKSALAKATKGPIRPENTALGRYCGGAQLRQDDRLKLTLARCLFLKWSKTTYCSRAPVLWGLW